ncbi:aldo/keto reductase [Actinoplanes sp. NPDC049802]|uniref:aldo/keto reductase n=1 Tax=Actinoplanes sp. NPDC049802 TaxID=3154742 RepID=UPI00340DD0FB
MTGSGTLASSVAGPISVARAAEIEHQGDTVRDLGRTRRKLPAVGLAADEKSDLPAVLAAFWGAGGRVIDTSRLDGSVEARFGKTAVESGITGDMFVSRRLWTGAGEEQWRMLGEQLDSFRRRLRRNVIDLLHVDDLVDVQDVLPLLGEWKRAGRIRHIGVGHAERRYHPALEILMRNAEVDVVRLRYSILDREAEEDVLPLAVQRGIGVVVNLPAEDFVDGRPVPRWAAAFGALTWRVFCLKYVLADPAVTVVLPPAGSVAQVRENMAALRGPLPDAEQRARMIEHVEGLRS